MTRGIFDPTGPNTERSGSTFTGPDADQISQMPPDIIDGVVTEEEAAEYREAGLEPTAEVSDTTPSDDLPPGTTEDAPVPVEPQTVERHNPDDLLGSPDTALSDPGQISGT